MQAAAANLGEVRMMDGNKAAAYGVLRCRPNVIAAYPITPQTPLLEALYRFVAEGRLRSETVEVEGELSAISVLIGASAAGGRTFTATSSQGLAFMFEAYVRAAGARLPIVMVVATRELAAPDIVAGGQQDVTTVRDAGWLQVHCESCQEILDAVIMAYRLVEDQEILLPINVCYDGYYLSHLSDRVEIPTQEEVDDFLAPLIAMNARRPILSPDTPLTFCAGPDGRSFTEYRYKHCAATGRARAKIDEIDADYAVRFGRRWGGLIEEYRTEDAEFVLVTMGSYTGTARVVVDRYRSLGIKIGLIKIRFLRPFPVERLVRALAGRKAVGVIDRSVNFNGGSGTLFCEMQAVIGRLDTRIPMPGFIGGLAGTDLTEEQIARAAEITRGAAQGQPYPDVTWLLLE